MNKLLYYSILILLNTQIFSQKYVAAWGDDSNAGIITSPFKTIIKAIYVANTGEIIYIEKGIYNENTTWNNIKESVSIIGGQDFNNSNHPVTETKTIVMPSISSEYFVLINQRNNITIDNIVFDMELINTQMGGIKINKCTGPNIVKNCAFLHFKKDAIAVLGSDNTTVEDNYIGPIVLQTGNPANSISIEAISYGGRYTANNNIIKGNYIDINNTHFGINLILNSDYINDPSVIEEDAYCLGNDIDGNIIVSPYSGIMISRQKNFNVHNNIIVNANGWAKDADGIYKEKEEEGGYGIHVGLTQALIENHWNNWDAEGGKIYNNNIYNSKNVGLYCEGGTNFSIINNVFMDNGINGTTINGHHALKFIDDTSPNMIFNNNLYFNSNNGSSDGGLNWRYQNADYDETTWPSIEPSSNINIYPGFIAPEDHDFNLKENSFLQQNGVLFGGYSNTSFNGIIRPSGLGVEIGAYEVEDKATGLLGNNGCKIVRDIPGNSYMIYENKGDIYFRTANNNNVFTDPVKLNDIKGANGYPTIAIASNYLYVTWQKNTSAISSEIYFAYCPVSTLNWTKYLLTTVSRIDPTPVIKAAVNNITLTYSTTYNNQDAIGLYYTTSNTPLITSWGIERSIYQNSSLPSATITKNGTKYYYPTVWTADGKIYYDYYDTDNGLWEGPVCISNLFPNEINLNTHPVITSSPSLNKFHIAWDKKVNDESTIVYRNSTDYRTISSQFSLVYYYGQELPSIASYSDNTVDLVYQLTQLYGGNTIYRSKYQNGYWSVPSNLGTGRSPSLANGGTGFKSLYYSGLPLPNILTLSPVGLNKEESSSPLDFYSRMLLIQDTLDSYIIIKIYPSYLTLKDGTKQRIDIEPVTTDTMSITKDNYASLLSFSTIDIPADAKELNINYSVLGKSVNKLSENPSLIFSSFNGDILKTEDLQGTTNEEVKKSLTINTTGLKIKPSFKLSGLKSDTKLNFMVGHIYDYRDMAKTNKDNSTLSATVTSYELSQNYPNPFNPSTTINYSVPKASKVTIKIYDILGKEIKTLLNEKVESGEHKIMFNANKLPSGVYFYRIQTGSYIETKKMILLK